MKRFLLVILLFGISVILNAEELHLTMEKVRELALKNNLELLVEEQVQKTAHADAMESNLNLLPKVNLGGSYTLTSTMESMEVTGSRSYGISVSQPIFNGGKYWLGARIKNEQAKIADSNYNKKRLSTIADAESKYFDVLENSDLLENTRTALTASDQHLKTAELRYELGTLSRADYLKMQSEKASKEVDLIQMQNLYEVSRIELANFLGISSNYTVQELSLDTYETRFETIQNLSSEEINNLVGEIISIGIEHNPSLEIASLSRSVNKKSLQVAAGEFLPTVNLAYSKSWNNIDDDFDGQGSLQLTVSVAILPIVDNIIKLNKARYDLKESEYTYHSTENEIQLALESSLLKLISSAKSVHASKAALDYAEETFYQTEERFKSNVVTATDLLDAEVLLTTSRNQYITSIYDFLRAKSSLLQQLGVEDENILWALIK